MPDAPDLGWWVIHGDTILTALRRVAAGEDPDITYAELHANATHEDGDTDGL